MISTLQKLAVVWLGLLLSLTASAGEKIQTPPDCLPDGIGVGGYDVLTYRTGNTPVMGVPEIKFIHAGVEFHFATEANRQAFSLNPESYLPEYDGWCAATLAFGQLICPDYSNFKVEGDRLLLFELAGFTNGRSVWNSDPVGFRERADENYRELLGPR